MKNNEAIRMLVRLKDCINFEVTDAQKKMDALNMAIKALEQEPCDDCISRQAVLDGLASIAKVKARSDAQKSLMGRVMFFVEHLSSVTPKEKTAAWVPTDEEPHEVYECNACGWLLYNEDRADFKYCPNCGAKMIEPHESEDKDGSI